MADVLKIAADVCGVHEYLVSVNTPDFPSNEWLINPDLSAVLGSPEVSRVYWKVVDVSGSPFTGSPIVYEVQEKTPAEKAATDECLATIEIILDTIIDATGIESENMAFVTNDPNRPGKTLTVDTTKLSYNKTSVANDEWLAPKEPLNEISGYKMPYDGTIIRAAIDVVDTGGSKFAFDAYDELSILDELIVVPADTGSPLGSPIPAGSPISGSTSDAKTDLDIDFSAGDVLRVRARDVESVNGEYIGIVFLMYVKWRLP